MQQMQQQKSHIRENYLENILAKLSGDFEEFYAAELTFTVWCTVLGFCTAV